MLLPIRSKHPPESLPIAAVVLIFVNCVVFALTSESAPGRQLAS